MRRLSTLTVDGVKSVRGAALTIPPLLAVQGPNGAGKSSLLQAIRLAVLGYEPSVGKTLPATRQLAGADEMRVALSFDHGFGIRRTFGKSVSTEVVPPQGERTEAQAQERINLETGSFLPSFDLAQFLALSAEKRRAALFTLLPRELAKLDEGVWREWLGYAEEEEPVKRAIDRLWMESVFVADSPIEGLSSALETIRTKFNLAEGERRAQVTVADRATADADQARFAAAGTEGPAPAAGGLDALQTELAAAQEGYAELKAAADAAHRVAERRQGRDDRLAQAGRLIADLERQIAEKQEALTAAEAADEDAGATDSARAEVERLEALISDAQAEMRSAREAAMATLSVVQGKLRVARIEKAKHEAALQAVAKDERCPICGSAEEFERAKQSIAAKLEAAKAELATADEAEADAQHGFEDAGKEAQARMVELGDQLTAARAALEATLSTARARERITTLRGEFDTLKAKRDGHADLRARLAEEEIGEPAAVDASALSSAEAQVASLRARIAEAQQNLEARGRAVGRADAARERADKEQAELDKRTRKSEALKRMLGALQRLRGHVIEGMVEPVETTANELLRTIDPAKEFRFVFEREGRDTFDFGFEEGGVFRGYDTASTGEDAFLAVVFIAALIAAVRPAWPVLLLDNAEAVDDLRGRRSQLMRALATLTDRIGNVILVGCCEFAPCEGWTILHAEAGEYHEAGFPAARAAA